MLITFRAGPVSTTMWDPESKQMYSPTCRYKCFMCSFSMYLMKLTIRFYHKHRMATHKEK